MICIIICYLLFSDFLITQLTSSTADLSAISEDLQVMWVTHEDTLEQMIKDGLVPEAEVESSGE